MDNGICCQFPELCFGHNSNDLNANNKVLKKNLLFKTHTVNCPLKGRMWTATGIGGQGEQRCYLLRILQISPLTGESEKHAVLAFGLCPDPMVRSSFGDHV